MNIKIHTSQNTTTKNSEYLELEEYEIGGKLFLEKNSLIYLSEEERNQIIRSLVDLRNNLIAAGKYTDLADETLCKLMYAKKKKVI